MGAYILRFVLIDSEPEISRTVAVPDFASLYDIHSVIQSVMSWEGYHLYAFEVDGELIHEHHGAFHDNEKCREPFSVALSDLEGKTIIYTYDFGDRWQVLVNFDGHKDDFSGRFPQLIDWKENAPIDDCGGIYAYNKLFAASRNPKDPDYPRAQEILRACRFDLSRVLNSLESWGMQGVIGEDREPLDHEIRIAMMSPVISLMSGLYVFDTFEEVVCKVTSVKKKVKTSLLDDMPVIEPIPKSELEEDPERYIQIWDSPDEIMSRRCNDFLKEHNLAKLCKKPGESIQAHYERAVRSMGYDTLAQWESEMIATTSSDVYSWAEKNGYYFFNPIDSPVAINEALSYKLHCEDVDISDKKALTKFMMDHNKEIEKQNGKKSKKKSS